MKISIRRVWKRICTASMAIFAVVFSTAVVGGTGTATYHYHLHGQLAEEGDTHVHGEASHTDPEAHQDLNYTELDDATLSTDPNLVGGSDEDGRVCYCLGEDVSLSIELYGNLKISGYVTLCLGGHTLYGTDPSFEQYEGSPVITVLEGANFILEDCVGTGQITRGFSRVAGGVYVWRYATFIMEGGNITGNEAGDTDEEIQTTYPQFFDSSTTFGSKNGAGGVMSDGNFIMNGGSITGNTVSTAEQWNALAGGVVIGWYGTFEMNGGSISENTNLGSTRTYEYQANIGSPDYYLRSAAGGILIHGFSASIDPKATINGGEISNNINSNYHSEAGSGTTATQRQQGCQGFAGGIAVTSDAHLYINGGTISGNQARYAMAIGILDSAIGYYPETGSGYVNPSVINISGGTITGHSLDTSARFWYDYGGALIWMDGGRLEIEGGSITGNTWNNSNTNSFVPRVIYARESGGYVAMSGGMIYGNATDNRSNPLYDIYVYSYTGNSRPAAALISGGYLNRVHQSSVTGEDDRYDDVIRYGITIEGGYFSEDSGITETDGVLSFPSSSNLDGALDTEAYTIQDATELDDPDYVEGFPYAVYRRGSTGINASALNNPTYDGEPIEEGVDFIVTSDMENPDYSYSYSSSDSTVTHEGLPTDAGTYTVTASVAIEDRLDISTTPHTYYDVTSGDSSFDITIEKADIQSSFFSYPQDEQTTFTYNGTEQYPDVNMIVTVGTGAGDPSYVYSSSSSEYIEVSPIDSGTYYIWATVTEGDNYNAVHDPMYTGLSFEITRANANPSDTPTSIEICEPTTLASVDLSDYDDSNGSWSWNDPSASVTGTGTYQATYTPNDSTNFNTQIVYVRVSVEGHEWGDWELDGDTHSRTCNRCGTTESDDHSWGLWDVITEPTESSEGLLQRECSSEPGHTESFTLPVLSETNGYTLTTSDPDCETAGEKVYTYEKDGQTFTFYVDIPATGHQWGDWAITVEPTQDTPGEAQRVCENDSSHTDTITLPALGDGLWTETGRNDPDCENAGWVEWTYTPDEGGSITFVETLDPLGHEWGDWVSNGDETHTRTCQRDAGHTETENCSGGSITDFENGTHGYICSDCGGQYDVSEHVWGNWTVDQAPSEDESGSMHRICSDCGARDDAEIPALGSGDSSLTYEVVRAPTCTDDGLGRYTYETSDGQEFTFEVDIPATGHDWGEWTTNGDGTHSHVCRNDSSHTEQESCTGGSLHDLGDGTHGYTCGVCGGNYNVSDHNFTGWVSDGTNGHYQVCDDCGAHSTTSDHTYGNWIVDQQPTQDQSGSMHRECSLCGERDTVTLPALDPDDGFYSYEIITQPGCETDGQGRFTYTTSDGTQFTWDVTIDPTGHSWDGNWISDGNGRHHQTCLNDPSHTDIQDCSGGTLHDLEDGTHGYTCTICGGNYNVSSHNYGNSWNSDGANGHYQVCDDCGAHSDTADHTYGDWFITQPTEDQSGSMHRECNVCGETETITLPALGSGDAEGFYTIDRTESTCVVHGYIYYYYTDSEGVRVLVATVELPLADHTFTGNWIADGTNGHYQVCQVCNTHSTAEDHTYGNWSEDTPPSTTSPGQVSHTCDICGYTETETIPALDPSNPNLDYSVITEPTCTADGLGRYTYTTSDGTQFTWDVTIDATGHNWDGIWVSDGNGHHYQTCNNDSSHTDLQDCYGGSIHDLGNGTHGYTCDVCGGNYDISSHNYGNSWNSDGANGHYQVCEGCGAHSDTAEHTYGQWVITEPTQDQAGSMHRECTVCHETETVTLPALGSGDAEGFYSTERHESTCVVHGYIYYYYTDSEGVRVLVATVELPLADHTFTGNWIPNGSNGHYQECQVCGAHSNTVDHNYGDWTIIDPTTSSPGSASHTCEDCGYTESETIPALDPDDPTFDYTVVTDPTCTEEGLGRYTYETSDGTQFTFDVDIPATGHDWNDIWVSDGNGHHYQTCNNDSSHTDIQDCYGGTIHDLGDGTHGYTCAVCGGDYNISSHSYGDWAITEPTQDQSGSMHRECSVCGHSETEILPALGGGEADGFYTTETRPSTCVAHGYINYYYTDSDGVKVLVASLELPLADHTFTGNWIADGSNGHYQECQVCQTHSTTVDHTYDNWTITQTPTEDQSGLLSLICSDCGYTETQVLPAFGGNDAEGFYTIDRIESTCTVAGRIDYYYVIEGNRTLIGSVSLPLLDHTFTGSWIADGSNGHYQLCEVCGNSSANMDHSFGEWNVVLEPTETQDGEQHRYCEHCGHLEIQTLPATGVDSNPGIDGGTTSSSNYKYLWIIPPTIFVLVLCAITVAVRTTDGRRY